jgi:hypothetical protein
MLNGQIVDSGAEVLPHRRHSVVPLVRLSLSSLVATVCLIAGAQKAVAAPCTLDTTGTTIDAKPLLSIAYV